MASVVIAAGVISGSAPAASQRAVSLTLRYACAFPAGSRPVTAQVTATFPAAATVGKPIQPAGSKIAVTLPRSAVGGLAGPHARAITLTAGLSTRVTEGTRSATAHWRHFRSPATAIPRRGAVRFATSGAALPVTASSPGQVTVSAAGLSLLFTTAKVNGGPAVRSGTTNSSSGTPGRPASIRAECVPRAGQDTTLARIAVAGPKPAKAPASSADSPKHCRPYPKHLKLNPRFPLPTPPPGSSVTHGPQRACANAAGYTNARKLKEAALVGPGLTDLKLGLTTYLKNTTQYSYLQQRAAGQFEFHGRPVLPPARATLLGFGFAPVSATIQISEIGSLNIALIGCAPNKPKFKCPNPPPLTEALFFGLVSLRISNVDVNGVPLNVGPHCQAVHPFNLELVGVPPTFSTLTLSGILTGDATIPKFHGCHDGSDNLDPIFDATVSGPGNFVKVNEAPFCSPDLPGSPGCPPVPAKPVH